MNPHTAINIADAIAVGPELADDLLRGADEINLFIFGRKGSKRKIYYLAETSRLPVFRLGSMICARKSVLLRWIADQEIKSRGNDVN